eukprot:4437812-Pyramimonas_sp.AAC.2
MPDARTNRGRVLTPKWLKGWFRLNLKSLVRYLLAHLHTSLAPPERGVPPERRSRGGLEGV